MPWSTGVGVALACWALLALLHAAGAFQTLDLRLYDWRHLLRGPRPASDRIALIEIDDATLAAYDGRWPLPRDAYAAMLVALEEAGAQAIGVDLLFLGTDPEQSEADLLLATVSAWYPNLVHAVSFVPEDPGLHGGIALAPGALAGLRRHGVASEHVPGAPAGGVTLPYPELLDSARALAHVSVAVDRDGTVRRVPMFVRYGDRLYPALALRLLGATLEGDGLPRVAPARAGIEVSWARGPSFRLPVDRDGATGIDFAGDRNAFARRHPMIDVLGWHKRGDQARLREAFGGRVVLIGSTAVGQAAADLGPTPFASATPLVYIHANAVNSLLTGRFVRPIPTVVLLAALAVLAAGLGWLLVTCPAPVTAVVMAGTVLSLAAVNQLLFARWSIDMPGAMALLLPPLAFAAIESFGFLSLERATRAREKELALAREIQVKLLPTGPPDVAGLDIFGANIPAQEIGGDYYDWVTKKDGSVLVALGDVSGHGVAAALLMSHLHASFHAEARGEGSPRAVLGAVHESLFRATEAHRFATFFLVHLPGEGDEIVFCNAGHNPALLLHEGGITELAATGLPLGMIEDTGYEEGRRSFARGDVLVIYSDGVTECPWREQLYGEERLSALIRSPALRGAPAERIGTAILEDVRRFCHGQLGADDITVVVVRKR